MVILGFIVLVLVLLFFTCAWIFMLFIDGAFGKRQIPFWWMAFTLLIILYCWVNLIDHSPFTIIVSD